MKLGIFIVLALSCMVFNANALTFYRLESFLDFREIFLSVPINANPAYAWWTPYYDTPTNPDWVAPINTATGYILSAGSLGGQRDQIIGFEITSNRGATASLVSRPSNRIGACYYTLGFVGGGYWQWDGVDDVGANAQPAKANAVPGIGSNTNYAYLPAHAAGGQTIDLTLGGAVKALNFEALTDLDCEYTWDFFDANNRSAKYTVSIATSGTYLPYQILFSRTTTGAGFVVDIDAGWAGFNRVAAIQLAVYTFQSATNAIDTEFRNLTFVGYQVTGNVVVDCDCTTANGIDRSVQNQPMTLRTGTGTTPTGTVLFTTNTDASGNFVFTGMDSGTYQVCLESPISGLSLCSGQTTCRPITLTGFVDPTPLSYVVLQPPTLTPPGPVTIECGACTDATVACTGVATLSDCNTGSTPVTSFQDTPSGSGCTRSISRRFFSGSVSATQVITILDRTSPVLITPAVSQSPQCNALTPTFSAWLANFGGATWTDCTSFTVSNGNPTGPAGCGTVTVTFTANDPCGTAGTPTTASYSILDSTDPTLDNPAAAGSATCNTNGSDLTAFNTWLSTRGGAVASDNCGTPTWTNNYSTLPPLTRGCNNAVTVTFTASDACGRFVQTSNSFTISDNVGPSASGATSPNDSCDANTNTRFNTWLSNNGNAVATDTCTASNLLTWTDDFTGASFPLGCRNSVTVTFTVFDQCSRTSSVTGTYTVTDNTAPRITRAPDNLNVACDSANQNGQISTWLAAQGNAVAVDDCTGSVIWTNNFANITTNCGSNTVTFTACDVCNPANCATTTALFSITDGQAPTYSTPPTSTTVPCDTNTESAFNAWINSGAGAVLIDNCDTDSIRFTNDNSGGFPFGCNAARTVNFNAVDACGNSATTVSATFRVTDNRAPIIQNVAQPLTVECNSNANSQYQTWRSNRGGATANDECAATVTWRDNGPASVSLPTVGCSNTVTVTFIGSDGCANEVFSTAAFTITDTVRPVISPGASPLTNECTGSSNDQSITTWLANNGGARATDACSQITWENNFDGLSGGCVSSATVVFTATDACGLASTTSAVYSISDTAAPVINPPAQPFTSQCGPNTNQDFVNWVNNHGGAVADDACQALSSLVWSDDIGDVTFSTCGRRTVTFTVTDPCDRSASTTAEFIVADVTAPAFNPSARDLSVECQKTGNQADYNNWLATRGGAIATDSCAVQLVYANNAPSVGPSRCASQTVTFTASDNCNNVGRTTATFSVVDSSAPVFTHFPLTRLADCSDPATNAASLNSWLTNFAGANAVDACTPSSELVYTAENTDGDGTPCITRDNYRFTVTDSCGRSVSETASFIIADIEDPFFIIEPSNATFVCDGQGNVNEIADWIDSNGGGSASDQCQGTVEWSNNYRGVGPFTCTSNLVTFVVSDGCGNDIAKTVLLTITDDQPPVFSDVPEDITVRCDIDTHPEFLGYPSAFDICTGNPIITFEDFESDEPPIGNCPGNHLILRTFSTFDECGNVATVDQLITVNLTRSAGPCDPEGCVCDDCCPDAAPSNCLPSTCQATPCRATPCTASTCLCPVVAKAATAVKAADELPQCEPIYIHVHDDDDTTSQSADALREPTMLVTNRLIDFKNKSDASVISFSVLLFFVMFFLF